MHDASCFDGNDAEGNARKVSIEQKNKLFVLMMGSVRINMHPATTSAADFASTVPAPFNSLHHRYETSQNAQS